MSDRLRKRNRYAGPCGMCRQTVKAGEGVLIGGSPYHREATWVGSPVSGRWVGGCPDEEDS